MNNYLNNLNEEQLTSAFNLQWQKHEQGYVNKTSEVCVEASIVMDDITKILFEKFNYSVEQLRNLLYLPVTIYDNE